MKVRRYTAKEIPALRALRRRNDFNGVFFFNVLGLRIFLGSLLGTEGGMVLLWGLYSDSVG